MSRRAVVMPLPKGVTRVRGKNGVDYWYHQERRGKENAGPRTRLPEFGTPEFWAAIAKIAGEPQKTGDTIKDLIDTYKLQPEWQKLRPNSVAAYGRALAHIDNAWGKLDPAALTAAHVMALRTAFTDRPAMGNLVLSQVRALMKLAVQTDKRKDNPAREIDGLEEDPDEAKPLSNEAWQALTSGDAPECLRRYAILARATGQRISDVLPLRPANRDEDGILLSITKLGDKQHWCPLRAEEIAIIDGWSVFKGSLYVARDKGRQFNPGTFRAEWNAFASTKAGAALAGFTPHDLRATKVCDERIRGKSHQQIAAMVGMSLQMVMKYSRHIDQRLAARGTADEHASAKNRNR